MTAYAYETQNERAVSGALTLVMHLLFFTLLVFGVAWQKHEPAAMVAELWSSLPAPKAAPPPLKVEPEPPKPQPEPEAKPVPKVEPKPVPKPVPKPDITLRDKKEKALKAKERELAEKKKREEQARLEALKQQQAKEAEAIRLAREQDEALRKLAQSQAAAQAKMVDDYIFKIQAKIKGRMNKAGCVSLGNPEIQLRIILLPDGNVLGEPEIRQSSGASPCDTAAMRAAILAQPLPVPSDRELFHSKFRDFNLRFRPNE
jgi:colicin import membrane protein